MKNALLFLVCLGSFQSIIFAWQRDLHDYQTYIEELIHMIHEKSSSLHRGDDDSNDRVDIDRWNELNDEAIRRMPYITDFSDQRNAVRWLEWFIPIIERYQQVRSNERTAIQIVLSLS